MDRTEMSLLRVFKALAEEARLQILALLQEHELSQAELVSILDMSQSRVSRHLSVLREAGLVQARRNGQCKVFRATAAPGDRDVRSALEAVSASPNSGLSERIRTRLEAALLRRRAAVSRFFDEKAADWDRIRGRLSSEVSVLRMLAPLLPQQLQVADLGTGTGALLPHLRRHAARVVGVDSSAAMLAEARARLLEAGIRDVALVRAELEALPLASGSLAAALCHMVLHYVTRPGAVLAEMGRVVAPGGLVAVADLAPHEHEELRESLAHQWLGFSREELVGWLEAGKLRLEAYEERELRLGEHSLTMFYATGRRESE